MLFHLCKNQLKVTASEFLVSLIGVFFTSSRWNSALMFTSPMKRLNRVIASERRGRNWRRSI